MLKVKMPGKLYIAGEYNILKPGNNAILVAINKYIYIDITENDKITYETRNKKYEYINNNSLLENSIYITLGYIKYLNRKVKKFNLKINSELETKENIKYGFGSSAALVTGIIKAILYLHNIKVSNEQLFKLAVLVQIKSDELSSGGDLAASIYKGYIYYERYDLNFVKNNLGYNLVNEKWPLLKIENINNKLNYNILASWSMVAYKTQNIKKEVKNYKNLNKYVLNIKEAMESNNETKFYEYITKYQTWLEKYFTNTNLYIKQLKDSVELSKKYNLLAKVSGAGGGDSVIVFYKKLDKKYLEDIKSINCLPIQLKVVI